MLDLKIRRIIIIAIFTIVMLSIISNLIVFVYGEDYVTKNYQVSKHQAAIVLGAAVSGDGQPKTMLKDRLEAAINLYFEGKVRKLFLTGSGAEVQAMKVFVQKNKITRKDLIIDKSADSTYESLYRAKNVYKIKDAVIISQKFHLSRSLFIAKSVGMKDVEGFGADKQAYGTSKYVYTLREYLANVHAVFRVVIG